MGINYKLGGLIFAILIFLGASIFGIVNLRIENLQANIKILYIAFIGLLIMVIFSYLVIFKDKEDKDGKIIKQGD